MLHSVRGLVRKFGVDVVRYRPVSSKSLQPLSDVSAADKLILTAIKPFTMTSVERQLAVIQVARYVAGRGIQGCFVECGVWRGGCSMAAALTFQQEKQDRGLYLYDTFEGMTEPTDADRTTTGKYAHEYMTQFEGQDWCVAGLDDVKANLASTRYSADRMHFIQGPVEQTLPGRAPTEPIAILRLDTDWYESTRHELEHLFQRLAPGGALLIDDYGHWEGARKAVDEFLAEQPHLYYMHRVDYTGRLLFK
jgi:O-methyltransferase